MTWQTFPINRFNDLAAPWDALLRQCSNLPFLESAFISPLLVEFGTGKEILIADVEADGWRSAAILSPGRQQGAWETFQPSQLPLGAFIGPKLEGQATSDWSVRLGNLFATLPGFSLNLGLTQLDSHFQPRPTDTSARRAMDYISTAWVDVEGSFDDYWEGRGKNLKQNTRKQRNKLEADGTALLLECVTQPQDVEQAMLDYGMLESVGWKASNGTAVAPDNAQGRFYRKMLENFCAIGRGRIYRYRFNDKVVSMDLCIASGPVIVILKTAYDESFKTVSPSTLMRQDEFRQLFEEQTFTRIEFYGKIMEWHTRWTDNSRGIYHLTQYRWPLLLTLHDMISGWKRRRGGNSAATA